MTEYKEQAFGEAINAAISKIEDAYELTPEKEVAVRRMLLGQIAVLHMIREDSEVIFG